MKVHIGPYLKWWGPYQIANLLQYVGVSEKRCDKIGEWLAGTPFGKLCLWVDDKRQRKVKVHIDNYDVWSMDHTLALIILPMLKKLKEQKQGTPYTEISDGPVSFSVQKEGESNEDFMWNEDRWNWILDEMIWTFDYIVNEREWEGDWTTEEHKQREDRHRNGLRLLDVTIVHCGTNKERQDGSSCNRPEAAASLTGSGSFGIRSQTRLLSDPDLGPSAHPGS